METVNSREDKDGSIAERLRAFAGRQAFDEERELAYSAAERLARLETMFAAAVEIQGDDEVLRYVKSGNAIPVTRCTVSADLIRQLVAARSSYTPAGSVAVPQDLLRRARNMCLRCISPELKEATGIVAELDALAVPEYPPATNYAAVERDHLGDSDKRTGIYAAPSEGPTPTFMDDVLSVALGVAKGPDTGDGLTAAAQELLARWDAEAPVSASTPTAQEKAEMVDDVLELLGIPKDKWFTLYDVLASRSSSAALPKEGSEEWLAMDFMGQLADEFDMTIGTSMAEVISETRKRLASSSPHRSTYRCTTCGAECVEAESASSAIAPISTKEKP